MQGLPTNLLTQNVATATAKVDGNSPAVNVNGKVAEGSSPESQNAFASLFSTLLGNNTEAVKGETSVESKAPQSSESKLDVLLKSKEQDQAKKTAVGTMTAEQAMSPEVLKNINNLLVKEEAPKANVGDKVAATANNLEELLRSLKGQNGEMQVELQEDGTQKPTKESKNSKVGSPLDFLIKESKSNDVGAVATEAKPEMTSKLGLSSEDFISQLSEAKEPKTEKNSASLALESEVFDPKALLQKQSNQSMKAYGQKQNLLNDNLIKNTKDLAFKDSKPKSAIDELRTPDMKIGAELSLVKEGFIPMMQKQEGNQNLQTQTPEKVLDLSKIDSANTNEIIKRISDYVEQSQVANKDSLDLTVRHESLGQFKIQVNKPMGNNAQMDMQITTSTAEGHEFFMKNEIGLMKNLSQAGIHLSDLRIVSESGSSAFAGNDSRQNNSQNGSTGSKEFMSFEAAGDSSHGSDRRKELWQEARANQQRYGA